jgi:hypothetical protein
VGNVDSFGVGSFNADDRSAQLNNGSYQGIPLEIRAIANKEFEAFVEDHIRNHKIFAIETTLRSDITFRQADRARAEGFEIQMRYIALNGFAQNLKRVIARALVGGHSAPADQLQKIHEAKSEVSAERDSGDGSDSGLRQFRPGSAAETGPVRPKRQGYVSSPVTSRMARSSPCRQRVSDPRITLVEPSNTFQSLQWLCRRHDPRTASSGR